MVLTLIARWLGIVYDVAGENCNVEEKRELLHLFTDTGNEDSEDEESFGIIRDILLHSKLIYLRKLTAKEVSDADFLKLFTRECWVKALKFVKRFSVKVHMVSPLTKYAQCIFNMQANCRDKALSKLEDMLTSDSCSTFKQGSKRNALSRMLRGGRRMWNHWS